MKKRTRTERLDMGTILAIKGLCASYHLLQSHYYELSELNHPGEEGRLSYMGFLAAMAGGPVSPQQDAAVARSLATVRQAMRQAGRKPVLRQLAGELAALAKAYDSDPGLLTRGDVTTLVRVISRGYKRLGKKRR